MALGSLCGQRFEEARLFLIGLGALLFLSDCCTWHALLFGGDSLAAVIPPSRFETLWSRHGAALDSWGSERTGRAFFLWRSGQFCWCRGADSSLSYPCLCKQRKPRGLPQAEGRLSQADRVLT